MKRTLLAVVMLGLFLPFAQVSKGADVSVDFFYNNLSGGSWVEVADYGYCWQPDIVVSNTSWRPYSDGYWTYTDLGWTWVSYEDFGWATYHYGRWARLADHGWVWVPGRDEDLEWGPAWVSWRTSDTYVGWAPLPPTNVRIVEGRAITGQVDIEFDIGPGYYNFCDVRYIGEPVLRERIVDVNQNVTFINQTVNVTNITYKNKVVYNYGPDINVINARAARPIQRLKIERQENVDVNVAMKSGNLLKPQGDKLIIAAPMHIRKSEKMMAPPTVKTKIEKVKVDRGWSAVGDEKAQTEFKQKIKAQDLHKIPTGAGAGAAGQAGVGASPAAGAGAAGGANAAASPFERGKHPGKAGKEANMTGAPGASPSAETSAAGGQFEKGKHKGKRGEETQSSAAGLPGAAAPDDTSANAPPGFERGKKGKHKEAGPAGAPPTTEPMNSPGAATSSEFGKGRKGKRAEETAPPSGEPAGAAPTEGDQGPGKRKGQGRRVDQGQPPMGGQGAETQSQGAGGGGGKHQGHQMQPTEGQPGGPGAEAQGAGGGGGKHKGHQMQPPEGQPAGAAAGGAPAGGGERPGKGEGKKHKGEASPVPSP